MSPCNDLHSAVLGIEADGFAIVPTVFTIDECDSLIVALETALDEADDDDGAIRTPDGIVYAARNVLDLFPPARHLWRKPSLLELLATVLGPDCGLVRGLYFDKHPERTWALPWHQDRTIAVQDNSLPGGRYTKPTQKAGVPHVEAPCDVLQSMLTLRIHLDQVTLDNGPLRVAPGSHCVTDGPAFGDGPTTTVLANRGDVLAIRPLVAHCSGQSAPGTTLHRRVLHLEFAASPVLDDGFEWYEFSPFQDADRRLETLPTVTGKLRLPMPPTRNAT